MACFSLAHILSAVIADVVAVADECILGRDSLCDSLFVLELL